MFFDPLEIPDELLIAQEQGKLVIFAGAGVSMGQKPHGLPSFIELAKEIGGSHKLADAVDWTETKHFRPDRFLGDLARGGTKVQELCRSIIGNPKSRPTEFHESLVSLFSKPTDIRIVTTNYDDHFDPFLDKEIDRYFAPALPLGDQFAGLVHLHGSIKRPERLVLTDEDFGRAYLTEGWAREFLQRLFAAFTTLFVGYSHNDILVEYLARGLSGRAMSPRFAITPSDEPGLWKSLGITDIPYERVKVGNRYENLHGGIRRWVAFSKLQPTEMAARVKGIVLAPPNMVPDRAQESLLKRCLKREDECHFFTEHANGWNWVIWLETIIGLSDLFDTSCRSLPSPKEKLACWLAGQLLKAPSDEGLLLVGRNGGSLGQILWWKLLHKLWVDEGIDWKHPRTHKWVLLLGKVCPRGFESRLACLLEKAAAAAPQTLGVFLLRRLTALRIGVRQDFGLPDQSDDSPSTRNKSKAKMDVAVTGSLCHIDREWLPCFIQKLPEIRESLLGLLENRLREAHELYQIDGSGDETRNPLSWRGKIYERDVNLRNDDLVVVLDLIVDVLKASADQGWSLPEGQLQAWLQSSVPTLVRLGLFALHLSRDIPNERKVEIVSDNQLVHPRVLGATHEAWLILAGCYAALDAAGREKLWQKVNEGPVERNHNSGSQAAYLDWRQRQIDKLTYFLSERHGECPEAERARVALLTRNPGFQGYDGMDQAVVRRTPVTFGSQPPISAPDLLSVVPGDQMECLLEYNNARFPLQWSREDLLHGVGEACAQDSDWGLALLEEIRARQAWTSDLWEAAFRRMNPSDLPEEKLRSILGSIECHLADSPSLLNLVASILQRIDLMGEKQPSHKNLEWMVHLSIRMWKHIKGTEPRAIADFRTINWTEKAYNHPAGQLADFWLNCCDRQQRESGGTLGKLPDWLREPLVDMATGVDLSSQLGNVALGLNLEFVYHIDPLWASERLVPRFRFAEVGEEAFLMWQPHVCYGRLSRDLILRMRSIYHEAFEPFRDAEETLQTAFLKHLAWISCSCLFEEGATGDESWLRDLTLGFGDIARAKWAHEVGEILGGLSEADASRIWIGWMKSYWEDRISGRPRPLEAKEADAMFGWIFVVGSAFPEAVGFIRQGCRGELSFRAVVNILLKHDLPEKHPKALLDLIRWFLGDNEFQDTVPNELEKLLFRLPREMSLVPDLNHICERLVSLAYPNALSLKERIQQEFLEQSRP